MPAGQAGTENIYYPYFSGERTYACGVPCEASELVHFRNRIGTEDIELIFKESIRVNGKDGEEKEATTDLPSGRYNGSRKEHHLSDSS